MNLQFDKSFEKSLKKIRHKTTLQKLELLIYDIEKARSISSINNVKKLQGFESYYRIRIGQYRIGIRKIDDKTIRFILICHRKDI